MVARLLLSGDVERNPGRGKKWLCTLCSLQIKTKSQTSIRCNHTTTHWVHLICTNITATQYTNTWKCAQHSTHTTQTQALHSKKNTNQFTPTPPQTATVACEPTPTSPPRTPAINPLKPRTPQTTSPTSATITNLPINSTPQSGLETCASATTTPQAPLTTSPSTPRTPQIAPATISPTTSPPQTPSATNYQQPKSTQQTRPQNPTNQYKWNTQKTHRTGTYHENQQHRHSNSTGDKTGQPSQNPHNTTVHHTQNRQITQKRRRTHHFHKTKHHFHSPQHSKQHKHQQNRTTNHQNPPHTNKAPTCYQYLHTTQRHYRPEPWHRRHRHNKHLHPLIKQRQPLNHRRHHCSLTPMALTHRRPPWDTDSRYNSELQPNHAKHKHTNPHTTTPKPITHLTRHHNHIKHTTKKH